MEDDTDERRSLWGFLKKPAGAQKHCLYDNVGDSFGTMERT